MSTIQVMNSPNNNSLKKSTSALVANRKRHHSFLSWALFVDCLLIIFAVCFMRNNQKSVINFGKQAKDYLIAKVLKLTLYRMNNLVLPNQSVQWSFTKKTSVKNDSRPDIIFIVADDLGFNDLHGSRLPVTKNIRKIGSDGVYFSKAYSGHATCSPSRSSMVTGKFPTRFGFEFTPVHNVMSKQLGQAKMFRFENESDSSILSNSKYIPGKIVNLEEMAVPTDVPMISEILHDSGYHTMFIGKWHMGASTGTRPWERGYEQSLSFLHGASQYFSSGNKSGIEAHVDDFMDDMIWDYVPFLIAKENGPNFQPNEYITDYLSKQAVEAIKATQHQSEPRNPFFLHLCYNAPHTPLHALKSDYFDPVLDHITNHRERVYVAMIKALDRGIEQIISTVRDMGEEDNTMVIFTSDNGGASYIGLSDLNTPFRGGKASFFEGGLRVPLLMKWPEKISPNIVHKETVGHVDIFSTLVSAASISDQIINSIPLDGMNLLNLLPEPMPTSRRTDDESITTSSVYVPVDTTTSIHPPIFWRSGHYRCLIYGNWKLSVAERPYKSWLYNLANDPTEQYNLAPVRYIEPTEPLGFDNRSHSVSTTWRSNHSISTENTPDMIFRTVLLKNDNSVSEVYETMYAYLSYLNAQQSEPIWPSLSETPVLIDKNIQSSYVDEPALTRNEFSKVLPSVFSYDSLWEVFLRPERPVYKVAIVSNDEEVVLWPN